MIVITYKKIRNTTILYLLVPFMIFLMTWIRPAISVPCLILLVVGIRAGCRVRSDRQDVCTIQTAGFLVILVIAFFWCLTAGIGGFFYQSPDHHFRNAVFRDLLYEDWPVLYKDYGTGLVYYLGIWIVPAFLGKILLWMGLAQDIAWTAANVSLLIWCSMGIVFLLLLMCLYFRQYTVYGIAVLALLLLGYSGLDIVGEIWKNGWDIHDHMEWWSEYFQFRSNTTSIFWAYNQAIPCWLMTTLLLSETDMKNYGVILASTLFYSPFAVVGVILCTVTIIFQMVWKGRKDGKRGEVLQGLFSCTNVLTVLVMVPVLAAYYACNAGYNMDIRFCFEDYGGITDTMLLTWIVFLILEAGVHVFLVAKNEYHNPLFYAVILSLVIGSIVAIGETGEVVFRISATMPALFMLMCFVIKTVFAGGQNAGMAGRIYSVMLPVVLALGIVTPAVEYDRAIEAIREYGSICVVADDLKTLNTDGAPHNFIGLHMADSFFYQYMMR